MTINNEGKKLNNKGEKASCANSPLHFWYWTMSTTQIIVRIAHIIINMTQPIMGLRKSISSITQPIMGVSHTIRSITN